MLSLPMLLLLRLLLLLLLLLLPLSLLPCLLSCYPIIHSRLIGRKAGSYIPTRIYLECILENVEIQPNNSKTINITSERITRAKRNAYHTTRL